MRRGVSDRRLVRRDARKLDSCGVRIGAGEVVEVTPKWGVGLADGGPWIEM
jgi:hypothetical protein